MTESYDQLPLYQEFQRVCRSRGIRLDPEWGGWVLYQGQPMLVAAVEGRTLALVDDLAGIPLDARQVLYVEDWDENPACLFLPSLEFLLQFIYEQTDFYPVMTPGIQETRDVWQLTHPRSPSIVCSSLRDGLVELAARVLDNPSVDLRSPE